jgi:hypothetical protein
MVVNYFKPREGTAKTQTQERQTHSILSTDS